MLLRIAGTFSAKEDMLALFLDFTAKAGCLKECLKTLMQLLSCMACSSLLHAPFYLIAASAFVSWLISTSVLCD